MGREAEWAERRSKGLRSKGLRLTVLVLLPMSRVIGQRVVKSKSQGADIDRYVVAKPMG